ncbi:transferase family-domain-containing protein [Nemania serpens]|nr:transferase family-domain-containing protein [Nemania serpens]
MKGEDEYQDLDRYQDVLGQLPMLQAYSHILYFFPAPPEVPKEQIIRDLEKAITKVRKMVPWMGARVINVGKQPGNSGLYRPIKCPLPEKAIDVVEASGTSGVVTYKLIGERKAPLALIDTDLLTPVVGYPNKYDDSDEHPAHVVRLQATFIPGGVIVCFALEHNMGDAGGHFGFVKLIAIAMCGEEFPADLLAQANYDRRRAVPLLEEHEPMLDHSHHRRPAITSSTPLAPASSKYARYHVFRFTAAAMAGLKELASQPEGFNKGVAFISTDDAVCAFCWQRLILARFKRGRFPAETQSRFGRQIDGRPALGLPPNYMGDVAHTVSAWMTFGALASAPLATIASCLRARLNETHDLYHIRSFATFIAQEPDKSTITYAGKFNPDVDVGCSSIRGLRGVFPEFGVLGRPEFIRRPPSVPFPSTLVLFPGTPEGDCDAVLCLTDADFETLMADEEWRNAVEYIG